MTSPQDGSHMPDPYLAARHRMIQDQLLRRGIHNTRILEVMEQVPRHQFVPRALRSEAYDDCALPIGLGQTISQPFTVAYMLQALEPQETDRVLEIGTGTGYNAALLSQLVREVHTVERIPDLAHAAEHRLQRLGYANVQVHCADGSLGWPSDAPYDGIIVTAAARHLPEAYPSQLTPAGRIVIPLGDDQGQVLSRFQWMQGKLQVEELGLFAFVPLISDSRNSSAESDESDR